MAVGNEAVGADVVIKDKGKAVQRDDKIDHDDAEALATRNVEPVEGTSNVYVKSPVFTHSDAYEKFDRFAKRTGDSWKTHIDVRKNIDKLTPSFAKQRPTDKDNDHRLQFADLVKSNRHDAGSFPIQAEGNLVQEEGEAAGGGGADEPAHWSAKIDAVRFDLRVFYKIVDPQTEMKREKKGDNEFFRYLPGFRLRLKPVLSDDFRAELKEFEWSIDAGKKYGSWKHAAKVLAAKDLKGAIANLKDIYWEVEPKRKKDVKVVIKLKKKDNKIVEVTAVLKARTVLSGSKGSDAEMAQAFLRIMGLSSGKYGWRGTPIDVDGAFGSKSETATKRFQTRDEIGIDGKVGPGTRASMKAHWNDYLPVFDKYEGTKTIGNKHRDFGTWVGVADKELGKLYTDAIAKKVDPKVTRRQLLNAWILHESAQGHWGANSISYRVVLGGYDNKGSIGFSQIQNRYRYGTTSKSQALSKVNLYDPSDNVEAFAIWSNTKGLGEGFYRVFKKTANVVTKKYKDTDYPRLTAKAYTDDEADKLSKGIFAYNASAFKQELRDYTWPDMLRRTKKADGTAVRKGIQYALEIKQAGGLSLANRTWNWTDQTKGKDGKLKDFAFNYSEKQWLAGKTWTVVRDAAAKKVK